MVKSSQMVRWLELDYLMRKGEYPNTVSFAKRYGCSSKTVARDIDRLRDFLGAPIVFDRSKGGYCYEGGYQPPGLFLWVAVKEARKLVEKKGSTLPGDGIWNNFEQRIQQAYGHAEEDTFKPYEEIFQGQFSRVVD